MALSDDNSRRSSGKIILGLLNKALRTMEAAQSGSGHPTAPVFTGASPDITSPSLTDTLPPFPMYAALPRSEYYGGSAPPAPSAGVAPIPPLNPWNGPKTGTYAGGSHVHCCPVDGLGIRLYPCGIATATAVGNSPWPPSPGR